jgi:hypothetical protein
MDTAVALVSSGSTQFERLPASNQYARMQDAACSMTYVEANQLVCDKMADHRKRRPKLSPWLKEVKLQTARLDEVLFPLSSEAAERQRLRQIVRPPLAPHMVLFKSGRLRRSVSRRSLSMSELKMGKRLAS